MINFNIYCGSQTCFNCCLLPNIWKLFVIQASIKKCHNALKWHNLVLLVHFVWITLHCTDLVGEGCGSVHTEAGFTQNNLEEGLTSKSGRGACLTQCLWLTYHGDNFVFDGFLFVFPFEMNTNILVGSLYRNVYKMLCIFLGLKNYLLI